MPPEGAAAEGAVGIPRIDEVPAVETEVVATDVADEPGVGIAAGRRAEEVRPVVEQRRSAARAAEAQVVDVEVPVDAGRRSPPPEHLERIPARQELGAEDLVVLDLGVVDVEGRLLGVRREHRPPEHGHAADRDRVAAARDQLLVLDRRLTRRRVDDAGAEGPGQRHLLVDERQFPRAELPARHAEAARRQSAVAGHEPVPVHLPEHVGPQPHRTRVVVHRREHRRAGDHAARPRDVVEHVGRLDHPLALTEDHVAFHVELERHVGGLRAAVEIGLGRALRPDDEAVARDVERAGRVDPVDDEVHARRDDRDPLRAGRTREPLDRQGGARPRKGAEPPPRNRRLRHRRDRGAEFAELRLTDHGVVRHRPGGRTRRARGRLVDGRSPAARRDAREVEPWIAQRPEASGPLRPTHRRCVVIGAAGRSHADITRHPHEHASHLRHVGLGLLLDPHDGLVRRRLGLTLGDRDSAGEMPDVVGPFGPPRGLRRPDRELLAGIDRRNLDASRLGDRGRQAARGKCGELPGRRTHGQGAFRRSDIRLVGFERSREDATDEHDDERARPSTDPPRARDALGHDSWHVVQHADDGMARENVATFAAVGGLGDVDGATRSPPGAKRPGLIGAARRGRQADGGGATDVQVAATTAVIAAWPCTARACGRPARRAGRPGKPGERRRSHGGPWR